MGYCSSQFLSEFITLVVQKWPHLLEKKGEMFHSTTQTNENIKVTYQQTNQEILDCFTMCDGF